jgi:hypothetical protein
MGNGLNKSKQVFAAKLLEDFKNAVSGNEIQRVVGKSPEKVFFVGKLSPASQEPANILSSTSKAHQIGMDFIISKEDLKYAKLEIGIGGDFYYRVFPTFEEQQKAFVNEVNNNLEKQFHSYDELVEDIECLPNNFSQPILPVYEKVSLNSEETIGTLKLSEIYDENNKYGFIDSNHKINRTIRENLMELEDKCLEDENGYSYINERLTIEGIRNEKTFKNFIMENSQQRVGLNWIVNVLCEIKEYEDDSYRVSVSIMNESPDSNISSRKTEEIRINTLFNSKLRVKINNASFQPIELDYFEDDYKYNRTQKAIGFNCSVDEKENETLETSHLPLYKQYRLKTRDDMNIKFKNLIDNPVGTLEGIHKAMLKELDEWNLKYQNEEACLTEKGKKQFRNEIKGFKEEICRFKNGIELIKNYQIIKDAFVLMNNAFLNSPRNYGSWRLFQIVFIVSLLLDIAATENDLLIEEELKNSRLERVDLLYFPTGGGKTEAFLGIMVFNLFFDRLRGKKLGTTAIVKYPLRLLSIQQFQRIANILASAEQIRRKRFSSCCF